MFVLQSFHVLHDTFSLRNYESTTLVYYYE